MKLIWKTNDRNSLDAKETNWRKRETGRLRHSNYVQSQTSDINMKRNAKGKIKKCKHCILVCDTG